VQQCNSKRTTDLSSRQFFFAQQGEKELTKQVKYHAAA
jgi:hypothetical protein